MFNKELFYALCDKYGVELSDQYDKPMLKVNGDLRAITDLDLENLVPQYQEMFLYRNKIEMSNMNSYMPDDLLIA